jgi:Tetratricopeptide repeat
MLLARRPRRRLSNLDTPTTGDAVPPQAFAQSLAIFTLIFAAGIASATAAFGQCTPPFAADTTAAIPARAAAVWRADLDALVRDVLATHPGPFTKTGVLTWRRAAYELREALPRLSEPQRVVRAMQLIALIGDGHTQLEPDNPTFARWYPVRLYEFPDGVFITGAHQSLADLAGARVVALGGCPAAQVLADVRTLHGADNRFDSLERLYAVHNAMLMRGLGYAAADGSLTASLVLRDGRRVERTLHPRTSDDTARYKKDDATFEWVFRSEMFGPPVGTGAEWVSAYRGIVSQQFRTADTTRPAHLIYRGAYTSHWYPESRLLYAQINQVDDTRLLPFIRDLLAEADRVRPQRLVLDIRYNFGGDGSVVNDVVAEFIRRQPEPPWRELYLVTGRKTFSAGIMFANALLSHVPLTVVGEPTGAAFNSYGDARRFEYGGAGVAADISTLRHQLGASDDLDDFIPVDVPARMSFLDYLDGRDPVMDPLLHGDEMRSIAAIVMSDGGDAGRVAWRDRSRRFAAYDWWAPPTELALRRACHALVEQRRLSDAVSACQLTAEIHPAIWNSWYNLGETLQKAGRQEEAKVAYRKVLELDPLNWNGPQIRRLLAAPSEPR